eukprot:CAMPEP_0168494514 /NCGR_PEP_ID=MMETSP0228-20121227/71268_1 /TAXON_ID=133427 /ORGANISM="Protoceratium reticulatum, Strain CCCM 535 (=CCMP 1889)" /LENGTH=491 /DNA_ID=CAMNT_0008511319 /DNA_START=121 /DNA_END=1596 /DNA_ORIENTATION=+
MGLQHTLDGTDASAKCTNWSGRVYDEPGRPQFHFTPARNWMSAPAGLVYYKGEYHLFFQHNPEGTGPGHYSWGHAVSADLMHWKQLDHALVENELMGQVLPGSAVVDHGNTTGLQPAEGEQPMVAIFAARSGKQRSQHLAFSTDSGRSWSRKGTVLPMIAYAPEARQPKVLYDADARRWVMVLASRREKEKGCFMVYWSKNLMNWHYQEELKLAGIRDDNPDMFQMPIPRGDPAYVFMSGDGSLGPPARLEYGDAFASQTFADAPLGRRLQMSWLGHAKSESCVGVFSGEAFTGQMALPAELELSGSPPRLRRRPAAELQLLREEGGALLHREGAVLAERTSLRVQQGMPGAGLEAQLRLRAPQGATRLRLALAGRELELETRPHSNRVSFLAGVFKEEEMIEATHWVKAKGRKMPLQVDMGAVEIRVFADRHSLEIFDVIGGTSMTLCAAVPCDAKGKWHNIISLVAHEGNNTQLDFFRVYELKKAIMNR